MTRTYRFAALLVVLLALLMSISSCSTTYERRDPTGEGFPTITATALDGRTLSIPGEFAGRETLLFVGYDMDSQFDIDRWLLGLHQIGLEVPVYELPTIPGLFPGLFAGTIDAGMRSGIPQEDWAIVVTIYDDADAVARFLGNETPLPARVVLLDQDGDVAFFHDRGYSTGTLIKLQKAVEKLRSSGNAPAAVQK